MEVRVDNLVKHFGTTKAVDGVSFGFGSGQVFGFVGPNGAGKTTTMRMLATLDEPTDGDITINGVSVVEEPEQARRLIGYMPDNLPTHRDMTVHDYLDFFARSYGLRGRHRTQTVESIEEFANLRGIREKMLPALSKGMKQRVSLARALIHDPPLLIMDEPAAGLDPRARVELRELVKVLCGGGKAVLISSHILTELAEICDGAVIIERGQVLHAGKLDDILSGNAAVTNGNGDTTTVTGPVKRFVAIRTRANQEALYEALLEMPRVEAARIDGAYVEAQVLGDEDDCCDLLAELLRREFRILEFKQVKADLEHIFMTMTKGEVQ